MIWKIIYKNMNLNEYIFLKILLYCIWSFLNYEWVGFKLIKFMVCMFVCVFFFNVYGFYISVVDFLKLKILILFNLYFFRGIKLRLIRIMCW